MPAPDPTEPRAAGSPVVRAILYALLCCGLVLFWQCLTVRYSFGGNWTALFCTGSQTAIPPALAGERLYRFQNSWGYDGQFYHFIAHDPLLRRGTAQCIDSPRLRWRRILSPALAFLAAAGRAQFVDHAIIFINLAWVFAGAYWLSLYCARYNLHPAWGLCFALVPASLVSMDRLTIDTSLAALSVGYALYTAENATGKLYVILLLAPLARETGLCLLAGYIFYEFAQRNWTRAIWFCTAAAPFAGWVAFVHTHTAPDPTQWTSGYPLSGIIGQMLQPLPVTALKWPLVVVTVMDWLLLLSAWLAFLLTLRMAFRYRLGPLEFAAGVSAAMFLFLERSKVWADPYGLGRSFSPWLILIACAGIARQYWWNSLPGSLAIPRILLQLLPQLSLILRGLFRINKNL